MSLAVVRPLESPRRLRTDEELEDYEQELIDQYAIAAMAAGITDGHIAASRSTIFELVRFLQKPVWSVQPPDADRYLAWLRKTRGQARNTIVTKAVILAGFYNFLIGRYQAEIYALTGFVVDQPIDEHNRPASPNPMNVRVPPRDDEIDTLFTAWGSAITEARKYLPAARDYFAASLWRRLGLRINETVKLDIRDWHPELGRYGKLDVRFGKGSNGRGPKARLVPAINQADKLIDWWLRDVRHQFGEDWSNPNAPMLPSERRDPMTGMCARVGDDALRTGLTEAAQRWLPDWSDRLGPHCLRHYCASSLYARGLNLAALQALLGHEFLSTTSGYIHVHDDHVETSWSAANDRVHARLNGTGKPADEGRRARHLEVDGHAAPAGRGRAGDQHREDVGAVDRHADDDPPGRPGRDLLGTAMYPRRPAHLRA